MDVARLLATIDGCFAGKTIKARKVGAAPPFAKVGDTAVSFQAGYVYWGSNNVHRPVVFMGVYTKEHRAWVHFTFQVKLRVPSSLRASLHPFFNSFNLASHCMFGTAGEHTRLTFCAPLPAANIPAYLRLLVTSTDQWFQSSMKSFVTWLKLDSEFKHSVDTVDAEVRYLQKRTPEGTVSAAGFKDVGDAVVKQLTDIGVKKVEHYEKVGVGVVTFVVQVEGALTGLHSNSFPAQVSIGPAITELKLYYSPTSKISPFSDPQLSDPVFSLISHINSQLEFGCFCVEWEKLHLYWAGKTVHCFCDKKQAAKTVEIMVTTGIDAFRIFSPKFGEILAKEPLNLIISRLTAKPATILPEKATPKEEIDRKKSSLLSETSNACSGIDSASEDEGDQVVIDTDRRLSVPITTLDTSNVTQFLAILPSPVHSLFCFDPSKLPQSELVHWEYDNRLDREACVQTVIDGFVQLQRNGVVVQPLPLDALTLSCNREFTLLPTFPVQTITIVANPTIGSPSEENLLKFDITSAVSTYLSPRVSKEKHITLASFKVFRALKDIDFISPLKFTNQNLSSFELIGKGGFGDIYRNKMTEIDVVLKCIKSERVTKHPSRDYLLSEFQLMQACTHPNVVRVFGYTKFDRKVMLVMEYCGRGTVSRYVHAGNPGVAERVEMMAQVADAMALMHAKRVVHFDIKPQNILLSDNLTPKICDFGLSQVWTEKGCKSTGFTLMYAPPEQVWRGRSDLSGNPEFPGFPADVWAFGILAYCTLFGAHPFDYIRKQYPNRSPEKKHEIYTEIITRRYKPLFSRDFESKYPQLVHLIRSCLRINPKHRPTVGEIVVLLEKVTVE